MPTDAQMIDWLSTHPTALANITRDTMRGDWKWYDQRYAPNHKGWIIAKSFREAVAAIMAANWIHPRS